jgi:hypothetical protein
MLFPLLKFQSFAILGKMASRQVSLGGDAGRHSDDQVQEAPEWFTSLQEFKPITLQLHSNKIRQSFFARSIHSGKYYVLKKYEKGTCLLPSRISVSRHFNVLQVK